MVVNRFYIIFIGITLLISCSSLEIKINLNKKYCNIDHNNDTTSFQIFSSFMDLNDQITLCLYEWYDNSREKKYIFFDVKSDRVLKEYLLKDNDEPPSSLVKINNNYYAIVKKTTDNIIFPSFDYFIKYDSCFNVVTKNKINLTRNSNYLTKLLNYKNIALIMAVPNFVDTTRNTVKVAMYDLSGNQLWKINIPQQYEVIDLYMDNKEVVLKTRYGGSKINKYLIDKNGKYELVFKSRKLENQETIDNNIKFTIDNKYVTINSVILSGNNSIEKYRIDAFSKYEKTNQCFENLIVSKPKKQYIYAIGYINFCKGNNGVWLTNCNKRKLIIFLYDMKGTLIDLKILDEIEDTTEPITYLTSNNTIKIISELKDKNCISVVDIKP